MTIYAHKSALVKLVRIILFLNILDAIPTSQYFEHNYGRESYQERDRY
jgi:hypothetical protein